MRCQCCGRVLVDADEWSAMPRPQRERIYKTHSKRFDAHRCNSCRPVMHQPKAGELAWRGRYAPGAVVIEGGFWVRKGLTLVPVGPRPQEREVRGWTE